ncbi:MAG: copper chaperone PCu(A)C [Rhodanobacter sp.]|jgi:copper(I)-binding protein|nr:copper chaperone PCu(A)C [Rhodanobacter sp.]
MKSHRAFTLLAGLLLASAVHASAADHVHASHAWIRVLPGSLPAGAYVTLENQGDRPVALIGASSAVYAEVMLHKSSMQGGMSRMAMVDSLTVPARGKAVLAPAGYHLMLMNAATPVNPGDIVRLTLKFSDGSTLPTDFVARPANALDAGDGKPEHAMPPMKHDAKSHPVATGTH